MVGDYLINKEQLLIRRIPKQYWSKKDDQYLYGCISVKDM
jgi:hypothetical protein